MKNKVMKALSAALTGALALSMAVSASAEEKKTLRVAMECSYAPYNWTQPDDSNGAVPISGSSDYAYGYDVMMAKHICDELGYDLEIVKLTGIPWFRLFSPARLTVSLPDSRSHPNVSSP